jgi:hypothetical protein
MSEMLLSGDLVGKERVIVKHRKGADDKPEDHLFFEMIDAPSRKGEKPIAAGQST